MSTPPLETAAAGADLEKARQFLERFNALRTEIHKVVIGQEHIILQLLTAMFAQGHTLIIGVPGLAKTLLVRTLAQALGWDFKRIQFTPDLMPSDITGTEILQTDPATGGRVMHFVRGPIFAHLILADEINRTSPKTQAALLEAMQEYTVTAAGTTYPLKKPFFVVATQNPIEHEGTYPLPEAQLDRFMFSIYIGYPSAEEECNIVEATTAGDPRAIDPIFSPEDVLEYQKLVRSVPVSRHVTEYAVRLARATRPKEPDAADYIRNYVEWGAGPRASQYLVLGAKCLALLKGKPAPSAEEVKEVAMAVLQHRVIPNYNATGEDITARHIVKWVLEHVQQPSYKH
ncbi:MAG: MoxR family ATPase [Gammaproteobacteria bacterium]|nr:MoxR family ATPase [Gammaproteobacteria bacterium]